MTNSSPIYQIKDVQHFYGNKKVLDIRSFDLEKGSIIGMTGPNGSGKTTFLKLLAFIQKPTAGKIIYNGKPEYPFSPTVRSKVTLLTQKPYLLKRTVFDNIAYGLKIRRQTGRMKERITRVLKLVGLDYGRFSRRMWHELSGGEAQRVAMAARLVLEPEVLLLDEPVASVDSQSADLIRDAAQKAREDWGTTLIIASHDLAWLFSVTDRQISILDGKLFSTGMENVIPGPFERENEQIWVKVTGPDQQLRLAAPKDKSNATAIIKKENIRLSGHIDASSGDINQVTGEITAMHLEKKQGLVMVRIALNGLSFELSLAPDLISGLDFYPGKQAILCFKPSDVEWI